MTRFRKRWQLLLAVLLLLGGMIGFLWRFSPNFAYEVSERIFPDRFHRFDPMIAEIAGRHRVDPALVKAVIWRESKLLPTKEGTAGERGLMQVSETAALEWAKAEKIASFVPTDLFDPKTNIEAGTWYLAQALQRWKDKDDPIPFALAEYNAGRRNVQRWVDDARAREAGARAAAAGVDRFARVGRRAGREHQLPGHQGLCGGHQAANGVLSGEREAVTEVISNQ